MPPTNLTPEQLAELKALEVLIPPAPWGDAEAHGSDFMWFDIEDANEVEILSAESLPTLSVLAEHEKERCRIEADKRRQLIDFVVKIRNAFPTIAAELEHLWALEEKVTEPLRCKCGLKLKCSNCGEDTADSTRRMEAKVPVPEGIVLPFSVHKSVNDGWFVADTLNYRMDLRILCSSKKHADWICAALNAAGGKV